MVYLLRDCLQYVAKKESKNLPHPSIEGDGICICSEPPFHSAQIPLQNFVGKSLLPARNQKVLFSYSVLKLKHSIKERQLLIYS